MLKKISHIILSVLLLTATMGMAISKHYCSGDLISAKLFTEAESCCDGPCDCCHNENHFYQVQDDFTAVQIHEIPQLAQTDIFGHELFSFELETGYENRISLRYFIDSPPPPKIQKVLSLQQAYLL